MTLVGGPPGPIPTANTFSWIFSNPFEAESELMRHAPSAEIRSHHIPKIAADKPILINTLSGAKLSWGGLRNDALRIAAGLRAQGLQPTPYQSPATIKRIPAPTVSPVVLLHLPNCLEFGTSLFGILAAGLTATMVSTALTSEELSRILHDAEPQLIITSSDAWPQMISAIDKQTNPVLQRLSTEGKVFVVTSELAQKPIAAPERPPWLRDWQDLKSRVPLEHPLDFTGDEARSRTAVILWSSGTSGKPKGVVLSHHALNASMAASWFMNTSYDANERWLGFVPFYHVFGLVNVLLVAPALGATVYIMPRYDPSAMIANIEQHGITTLHMAPPVLVMLAKSPLAEGKDFSTIRNAVSGGAPIAFNIVEMVHKRTGIEVKSGYGLSEAVSVCNQLDAPPGKLSEHRGNTGPPFYGIELKIIDGSKALSIDQEGEILIRSPSLMNGYLNNEASTMECLDDDGWFHTGDLGKVDDRGYLWITGRLKEIIKVKGFQVSPSELESVLHQSPLVADAAVSSVFDPVQQTERPRGFVVPMSPDLQKELATESPSNRDFQTLGEELKRWTEKRLAGYKQLRGNLVFVSAIPKSNAGKILRRELKDAKGVQVDIYPSVDGAVKAKL